MIRTRAANETEVQIEGPVGKLEAVLGEPISEARGAFGIICHPHSLHGGSMQNKVVTTLTRTFQHCGLHTIRFNFRGVGKSEGQFDQGSGELDDLIAVMNWIKEERANQTIWLGGFSFGAFVTAKAATQFAVQKLVLIAPPVVHFPMQTLTSFLCPWVLVQGEKDEVVSADAVFAWAENCEPQPTVLRFPEATHFFHGQLTELRTALEKILSC